MVEEIGRHQPNQDMCPGQGYPEQNCCCQERSCRWVLGCTAWDNLGQVTCSSLGLRSTWMLISHKRLLCWLKICKDLF